MGISHGFDEGFFEGGSVSSLVPGAYPIAIDGRPYLIDLKSGAFKRQSIQILRQQADNSNLPGEASINPEDLWRRAQQTWHLGAGQDYLDREESQPSRFNASKGVDVWTKWKLSLLPDTVRKTPTSSNVNQNLMVAGSYLYWSDGATLRRTSDPTPTAPTFTTITGTDTNPITSIASNGYTLWIAQGSQGVLSGNTGATSVASVITGNIGLVAYVKGRLMLAGSGADKHRIWNAVTNVAVTTGATGVWPDPLLSHNNTDFQWVGFAEGLGNIYAAGYSGDKSLIYRITIEQDGTALDSPIVAGELPDGEVVRSIQGYLGYILIGTDKGVRFASADGQGNLTLGSLIRTDVPVRCFEPQDRFVWFGWSNYDATSTGLGRLDLSNFTGPLTPAFASDLMVTAQGTVTAVVTFGDRRYYAVSEYGLVGETGTLVSAGTIDSGKITYGIPDAKVSVYAQVKHEALLGTVTVDMSVDGAAFENLGLNNGTNTTDTSVPTGQRGGSTFELRLTLARGSTTVGPVLFRVTLRSYPGPSRGRIFIVPLLLHESIEIEGQEKYLNPLIELNRVESWITDHRLVLYQEASNSYSVFVEDYEWQPYNETADGSFWNGTCIVKLKSVTE
jgi:hypothetical protein